MNPMIALSVKAPQIEPTPDPGNKLMQLLQMKGAVQQQDLAGYGLNKAKRQDDQTNALMTALQGGLDISTPEGQTKALTIAPEAAQTFIKNRLEGLNTQAQIGERNATAGKNTAETVEKTIAIHRNQLANVRDQQSATQWLQAQYNDPVIGPVLSKAMPLDAAVKSIPADPQGFQRWVQQQSLGMTKYLELNKPTTSVVNAGGTSQVLQTPGLGGAPQTVQTVQHTPTPGDVMTDNRTRALHADTVKNENLRAGVGPGGTLDDNAERTAQAIANGQLPAPTGMALLNPKNQRILGRVMEINPQYDATTVDAKRKAARDFGTGQLGNSMRSFQVAGQHLDQLGQLVDALNNGNLQIVNKIGNLYANQTGSPAPTNFEAAKDVVSKEVVKAIVAGGGGVAERQELAHLMDQAKSPAQLKGVIQQYRNLMSAQHDALLQQRRAAGLTDATLPNYAEPGGAPAAGGSPMQSAIDAELARRGGR